MQRPGRLVTKQPCGRSADSWLDRRANHACLLYHLLYDTSHCPHRNPHQQHTLGTTGTHLPPVAASPCTRPWHTTRLHPTQPAQNCPAKKPKSSGLWPPPKSQKQFNILPSTLQSGYLLFRPLKKEVRTPTLPLYQQPGSSQQSKFANLSILTNLLT